MHTADLMKTPEFSFMRGQQEVKFSNVLPEFTAGDRIGVVSVSPGDSLRAAPLLLAAVGAYYEDLRERESDFYLYPDFFVFHIGELQCYHSALDVWPQSKEVVVPPDPHALLAAINDRGVQHLILPDAPRAEGRVMLHAAQGAARRLKTVLTTAQSPGQEAQADFSVEPSAAAAQMIEVAARRSVRLLGEETAERWTAEADAVRHFSYAGEDEALAVLCSVGDSDPFFGFEDKYRSDCGITEESLSRDTHYVSPPSE